MIARLARHDAVISGQRSRLFNDFLSPSWEFRMSGTAGYIYGTVSAFLPPPVATNASNPRKGVT